MSATYTLHTAAFSAPGDPHALDRAVLVRDGFSWGAFLVPMLWFFRHGHWLLGLGALVLVGGLALALGAVGLGVGTILAAEIVLHLLLGLEGSSLRRWAYARRGRPVADVVTATDEADAEAKSFARWLAPTPLVARPIPPIRRRPLREPDGSVIGLFAGGEGRP